MILGVGASGRSKAYVAVSAPANLVTPFVDGGLATGATLTCIVGVWQGIPSSYAYQWQELITGVWTNISGQTSRTYTTDHAGTFRCAVTGTNGMGTSSAIYTSSVTVSDAGLATYAFNNAYLALSNGNMRATPTDASNVGNCISTAAILEPTYFETRLYHAGSGGYIGVQLWAEPDTTLIDYAVLGLWYGKTGVYSGIEGQYAVDIFAFYGLPEEFNEDITLWTGPVPTVVDMHLAVSGRNVWIRSTADPSSWWGGGNPATGTTPSFVVPGSNPILFGAGGVGTNNYAEILDPADYTGTTPAGFRLGVAE